MVGSRPPPPVPSSNATNDESNENEDTVETSKTESKDNEMKTEGKDDSRTATSSNHVEQFWNETRNDDKKNEDIRRACLLYNIKDMMSYKEGLNEDFADQQPEELVTPHESAEHLNGRYVLSREVLIKNQVPIRDLSTSSTTDLLPQGWGVHFDGVFEHQFFYHSLSEYSTWKRPKSGVLTSNMIEDSAAELMEIVRAVCDRDSRAWLGFSENREKCAKREVHEWELRVPDLQPRMKVVRVSLPEENAKPGQLVRIEHEGMKYDVPVPTDVSLLKKSSSGKTTFPVAFPIQETRARRHAKAFDDVLKFQFDGKVEENMGELVERELKEHNLMLESTPGRVRVIVDRILSLFWL